jgi:hypothetical protein
MEGVEVGFWGIELTARYRSYVRTEAGAYITAWRLNRTLPQFGVQPSAAPTNC